MYNSPFPFMQPSMVPFPVSNFTSPYIRAYPPIDIKVFSYSVKSFRVLLQQGQILLDHLENLAFARRIMHAAQHGNKAEVDRLIRSIGLKVPITSRFTPTGITFEISMQPSHTHANCCILSFVMRWGE